ALSGPRASRRVNFSQSSVNALPVVPACMAKLSTQNSKVMVFRPNSAVSARARFTGRLPSPKAPTAAAMPASTAATRNSAMMRPADCRQRVRVAFRPSRRASKRARVSTRSVKSPPCARALPISALSSSGPHNDSRSRTVSVSQGSLRACAMWRDCGDLAAARGQHELPDACRKRKATSPTAPVVPTRELAFLHDQTVDEEHDDRPDYRAYPPGAFSGFVQTQGAAEVTGYHCADNPQNHGHDDAHLLIARHDGACQQTDDEANDDHADDTHVFTLM